jgi:hypothetical protein
VLWRVVLRDEAELPQAADAGGVEALASAHDALRTSRVPCLQPGNGAWSGNGGTTVYGGA